MSDNANERKLAREIASRKAAEKLLEEKSLELYQANQHLNHALVQLKRQNLQDIRKFEFDDHINDLLIRFGRVFLSRSLDDGLIGSYLSSLQDNLIIESAGLWLFETPEATSIAQQNGLLVHCERAEPAIYARWDEQRLILPIEMEYRSIGQLEVVLEDSGIEQEFIQTRLTMIAELLCSAISREVILASAKAAKKRAEESEKATREFVAMINHELRTPLNGLLGSAELLGDSGLDKSQMEMLNNMSTSGELLRHIINDLLDFSKMNAGMLELTPRQFEWQRLHDTLLGIFTPKADEKRLDFSIKLANQVPDYLIGDFDRLCQILVNLVGNAIKYTLEGSVELIVSWSKGTLSCVVKDTGIGIPEQAKEHLFNPFVQADRTTKRLFEGTGLGLSICAKLLELMKGSIEFESEVGKGSTFCCRVPLKMGDPTHSGGRGDHITFSPTELEALSILVVDDIKMNQVIIHQMLKKLLIGPDFANNGIEAIQQAQSKHYDIIFMDCRMPEMDGFEATDYLRKQDYKRPIVALTAGTTLEERERCIQCGMNDILTKPYTLADLKMTLEKWGKVF